MRAMILAAGLGTRLQPLSLLRPKPAMPVLGRPVIAYLLELLEHHGVREVMINLHHLPDVLREAVSGFCPPGLSVRYSLEPAPLGTGGGIRRVADFLRDSDPSLVLAGDMILDVDLTRMVTHHHERSSDCTLLLREDPRLAQFGTLGLDSTGRLCRIASRFDLGGESQAGLFMGVRLFSPRAFDFLPDLECFEDLSDWLAPATRAGNQAIRGVVLSTADCIWEPVGTPSEYLRANLELPDLSFLPLTQVPAPGTQLRGAKADLVVLGARARLGAGVRLQRVVVWEDEIVPDGLRGREGVFAGGALVDCS